MSEQKMNGAESLVRTALAAGVELCLANPGTSELQLVAALDSVPGIRAVLGLFEGVCTGAADGYARMTGRPAMTLLHLGAGLANGIANLHNARRACSPVVNIVGDHASWHVRADAPLTSDILSLARPVSGWVRSAASAEGLAADTAAAIAAAAMPPGQVATLIVPNDCAWDPAPAAAQAVAVPAPAAVADENIAAAAVALSSGLPGALLLGGSALRGAALRSAARVAAAVGCRLIHETFPAHIERGVGAPVAERLPYFPEQVLATLGGLRHLVLVGVGAPVSFFGYRDTPSRLVPEGCEVIVVGAAGEDLDAALAALAEAVGASEPWGSPDLKPPEPASGELTPDTLGQTLAALQPEDAIVIDESATTGLAAYLYSMAAPPHSWLTLSGGAIGQGLPCAVGAALACPDRSVIALQADGSGMYTLQSLWTMAREGLDVTVVVCANRAYRVLQMELHRAGVARPGPAASGLTDLSNPTLDWVALAQGMGVPASSVDRADGLAVDLERALAAPGPCLIEAVI